MSTACLAASSETAPQQQKILIVMTTGTNDPLKTEIAVLSGFGLIKNGHKVDFLHMGEAGSVIDEDMLRNCNGFGLPPITKLLDDECMSDSTWYV
jgi:predicted peroxiredoxin